jgi:hypothetical protein
MPSVSQSANVWPQGSRIFLAVALVFGVLLAGAGALWAHYGTALFYEMILTGIAACF